MNLLINILLIVLPVLSLLGLIFLTQLTFNAKTPVENNVLVSDFSNTKLTISKITLVLVWIQLILSLVATIYAMGVASK